MSGLRDGRRWDLEKPLHGRTGRVINMYEQSAGMAGNQFIAHKAHRDGSPILQNWSEAAKRATAHVGINADDRQKTMWITNEPKKSLTSMKLGGTPMKKLIAQEMSKETEPKRKPVNAIARLMGLEDALPAQQPVRTAKKSLQEAYPRSKSAGALRGRRQQEVFHFSRPSSCEIHSCSHEKEYKDVYEAWEQPARTNHTSDQAQLRGRNDENQSEKRMALVRQKFVEAKRLVTDEKLLHSKEFQDALEVLSSNRDLFLKFLDEPYSLLSKNVEDVNKIPSSPQTKRITLLKPSTSVDTKAGKHAKIQQRQLSSGSEWEEDKLPRLTTFSHQKVENVSHTTRIVVLKPSPAQVPCKEVAAKPISSPELPQQSDFYQELESDDAMRPKEIAKKITLQSLEAMRTHRRDESLLSSVLSNGYVGDDSSFEKSGNDFIAEDIGNFSDSEIMTPTSRISWDHNNRMGSPYSHSSFSQASHSPESSVIIEAKKRLSERWAIVATNGISQEQMQVKRSSSTLGEMLAISEIQKQGSNGVSAVSSSSSCGDYNVLKAAVACSSIDRTDDGDCGESFASTLTRSRSVPVSSSAYENSSLVVETSDSQASTFIGSKDVKKPRSGKSSFKGKVSSFFSRSKKPSKQKTVPAPLVASDNGVQSGNDECISKNSDECSQHEERPTLNPEEESEKTPSRNDGTKWNTSSSKAVISLNKPKTSETLSTFQNKLGIPVNTSEYQDHPSPTSVLDVPFVDDVQVSPSSESSNAGWQQTLSRSAPIESVARSLSWESTYFERALPNPLELPRADEEEHERFSFVQSLLSSVGLDNVKVNAIFTGWHLPDSPLDPMLLVKFIDRKEEGASSRKRRSSQRLLFDCVNAVLLDIGGAVSLGAYPWARTGCQLWKGAQPGALVSEEVWHLLKDWFSGERTQVETDNNGLVIEGLLRKGVAGQGWTELEQMEVDEISREIGGKVLEDLVIETLSDFIGES